MDECAEVFWKAITAETDAGIEELRADAGVEPDAGSNFSHVGIHQFA